MTTRNVPIDPSMARRNSKLVRSIIAVAETALPLLGPQGAAAAAAIMAIQQLLRDARGIAGPQDAARLDALQARVNKHSDQTIGMLRGGSRESEGARAWRPGGSAHAAGTVAAAAALAYRLRARRAQRDAATTSSSSGAKGKAVRGRSRPAAADGGQPELEPREYRVWFGTNRKPVDPADPARGFTGERDEDEVRYGHCDVYVPRSHKMGSIGSSPVIRWLKGKDDRLRIRRLAGLAREDFWAGVRRQIERAAPGARHAVVLLHGYRTSFNAAALRAAQIGFDLGIEGAMGFFSWPSRGTLLGYFADDSALEDSEEAIADFLVDFGRRSGAEAVHVIAHSMGNRGLLRAANRIVADAAARSDCRFGQFILAAPDVDSGQFRKLAAAYSALAKRTTLYVSSRDLAVRLSRWIRDYPRVGFYPPVSVVDGIDTVSVSDVDLTLLGHGYVAEAEAVLYDMERLISTGEPPPRIRQEEALTPEGRRYWTLRA